MSGVDPDDVAHLIDLAGRLMLTHAIGLEHAMCLLGIDRAEAEGLVRVGRLRAPLDEFKHDRLRLFVNILLRLEWRLHHDSRAIRLALETPIDALNGAAPADLFGGSLDDLRSLRGAVETIEAPKVKWWRVGH